jgi:hypothetical protein
LQELLPEQPQPTALQAKLQARTVDVAGRQVPYVLIADSAYGASKFVLPAFKHTTAQADARRRKFNKRYSSTRMVIECAYGRLKQRWRVLLKPQMLKVRNVVKVVTACCVLHNICDEYRCIPPPDRELEQQQRQYRSRHQPAQQPAPTAGGADMREAFVDYINS